MIKKILTLAILICILFMTIVFAVNVGENIILEDDFNDNNFNTTKFTESTHLSSNVTETGEALRHHSIGAVSAYTRTTNTYLPANKNFIVQVLNHSTDGGFKLCPTDPNGHQWDVFSQADWYNFQTIAGSKISPNKKIDGVSAQIGGDCSVTVPYWLRMRVNTTSISFDYVNNQTIEPTDEQWITCSQELWSSGIGAIDSVGQYVYMTAYNTASTGISLFDNFFITNIYPTINITYPLNITYNINISEINYSVSDNIELDSCWWSNSSGSWNSDNVAAGTNFTGLTSIEGSNTWTVYCNDTINNINSKSITFVKETIYPQFSAYFDNNASLTNSGIAWFNATIENTNGTVLLSINNTNYTSLNITSNVYNVSVNLTSNGTYNYYWLSWGNGSNHNYNISETRYYTVNSCVTNLQNTSWSDWTNLSCLTDYTMNQSRFLIQYDNNYCGEIENQTIYEYQNIYDCNLTDSDSDGVPDHRDNLKGNETNVTKIGVSSLNVTINGNSTSGSYNETQQVSFYDGNTKIMNFTHNFSLSQLDLSKVVIIKSTDYIIINLSNQLQSNYNKTIFFTDNSFISLCVKDDEISSISEISSGCNDVNETDFTLCLNNNTGVTNNSITCVDEGSTIKVSNLRYSAIKGTTATISPSTSSGGGGSTTTIKKECIQDKDCKKEYSCYNNKCVKLFDIKIEQIPSPVSSKEFFNFTYYMKGMAEIKGDVIVKFWLEQKGNSITKGQETIYLGTLEEKRLSSSLYLPSTLNSGIYRFYVQVNYENYTAESYKDIEVMIKEGETTIFSTEEEKSSLTNANLRSQLIFKYLFIGALILLVMFLVINTLKLIINLYREL